MWGTRLRYLSGQQLGSRFQGSLWRLRYSLRSYDYPASLSSLRPATHVLSSRFTQYLAECSTRNDSKLIWGKSYLPAYVPDRAVNCSPGGTNWIVDSATNSSRQGSQSGSVSALGSLVSGENRSLCSPEGCRSPQFVHATVFETC